MASVRMSDFLKNLGLQQYLSLFRDNNVTVEMLRQLSDDDLKALSVHSADHRRAIVNKAKHPIAYPRSLRTSRAVVAFLILGASRSRPLLVCILL